MNYYGLLASLMRVVITVVACLLVLFLALWFAVRQPVWSTTKPRSGVRANPLLLRQHVTFLSTEAVSRNPIHPQQLNTAADYIRQSLQQSGAEISEQRYKVDGVWCRNIIGRFGPKDGEIVVIGAHYDVFGNLPGADDNASGVAGLLELARLLATQNLAAPVELVAYSTEEPPYFGTEQMGSSVHARKAKAAGSDIQAMIALEMIGHYAAKQPHVNVLLKLVYPSQGNFVVAVGRWGDRQLARTVKRSFNSAGAVPCYSYSGPIAIGADLSDHSSYWAQNFPAIMITDTAHLRNTNYHTASDTVDTLDFDRMASVVDGILAAVVDLTSKHLSATALGK